jgi:fluoride exporter
VSRPHHLHGGLVLLVGAGGAVGTGARYLLSTHWPAAVGAWPVATLVENLVGAFLLGLLLEALVRRGSESSRGRLVRLGVGTGVLGGFTTFSALALELERLLAVQAWGVAVGYAVTSLVAGVLLCLLGVVLAARHHRWRHERGPAAGARS